MEIDTGDHIFLGNYWDSYETTRNHVIRTRILLTPCFRQVHLPVDPPVVALVAFPGPADLAVLGGHRT